MMRTLKVVIDGKIVAELKQGDLITIDLPDDAKEIWGKMDWGKTTRMRLDEIPDGKILVFKAYFTLNPFRNIGIMSMPFEVFSRY